MFWRPPAFEPFRKFVSLNFSVLKNAGHTVNTYGQKWKVIMTLHANATSGCSTYSTCLFNPPISDDQELRRTILSPDDAAPVELTAEENVARTLQENAPESHAEREQHIKKTVNNELGVYGSESYLEPIQRQIQPLSLQKTLVEKQKTEEEEKKEVQEAKEVETSEAELRRELIERLLRELDEQR